MVSPRDVPQVTHLQEDPRINRNKGGNTSSQSSKKHTSSVGSEPPCVKHEDRRDKQPQTHLHCAEEHQGAPRQSCWSLHGQWGALGRPPVEKEPVCSLRMTFFLRNTRYTAHHPTSSVMKLVMLGCVHTAAHMGCELQENSTFLPKSLGYYFGFLYVCMLQHSQQIPS